MARALLVGVAVGLVLTGCTSGDGSSTARTVGSLHTPVPSVTVVPVAAPELVSCPAGDRDALSAALPGSNWTRAAVSKPDRGLCVVTLRATTGGGSVVVTLAPTSTAVGAVADFRASPPALAGAELLEDLHVGVPSAGVWANGKGRLLLLLQAARPAYLVSVEVVLPATSVGLAASVGHEVMSWALAQQPR